MKRTALLRKRKKVFRRYQSQPVDWMVQGISPVLRGWVNGKLLRIGALREYFSFLQDWVERTSQIPAPSHIF